MADFPGAIGESVAILGALDPAAIAATTSVTSWGSAAKFKKVGAILLLGATNGTIEMELRQATDSSGTGAKDFSPAVAFTAAIFGAATDNTQGMLSCDVARCMDVDNGFTHFAASVVSGGTTNVFGVILLGAGNRFGDVSSSDDAAVREIVSV